MEQRKKGSAIFMILVLLFLSVVILILITGEIEKSYTKIDTHTVSPVGHLSVRTTFGTIHIETTTDNHLNIAVTKLWKSKLQITGPQYGEWVDELFEDFNVTIEYDDPRVASDIRIEGKFNRGQEYWEDGLKWFDVEIKVSVPPQYDVTLKTASRGDIYVGDLVGTARAMALGGNLEFGEIQGEVWGKTGVWGDISLKGCQSNVALTTALGDIHAEMETQPQSRWFLNTSMDGEIVVRLPADIAVDLDAETQGAISNNFSTQFQGALKGNRLEGRLNGGGPLLMLRSTAGDIRLKGL